MVFGLLPSSYPDLCLKLEIFCGNLILLSLIIATEKYIYCPSYQLLKALSQSNLTFNFESYLPNHAKMTAILIFSDICGKGTFFTFYLVNSFLLSIYLPKYLPFPLNTITNWIIYVTEHVFLQDNGSWKLQFFIFSVLEDFNEKTYGKTCHFYIIFPKFISNCKRLPSFTLSIFF